MIGTDNQWMPFYKEKRPVIADLIVERDLEGLEKFYGKKRVRKSSVVEGAYEASGLLREPRRESGAISISWRLRSTTRRARSSPPSRRFRM